MQNDKYVVLKTEDFERIADDKGTATRNEFMRSAIDDAIVIRQQDIFAAPALHSYASSIAVAITVLRGTRPSIRDNDEAMKIVDVEIIRLQELADFFHAMAVEAEAKGFKTPD